MQSFQKVNPPREIFTEKRRSSHHWCWSAQASAEAVCTRTSSADWLNPQHSPPVSRCHWWRRRWRRGCGRTSPWSWAGRDTDPSVRTLLHSYTTSDTRLAGEKRTQKHIPDEWLHASLINFMQLCNYCSQNHNSPIGFWRKTQNTAIIVSEWMLLTTLWVLV